MSSMNFTCDVCGREVFSCTFVNGMKFCAKCYQETFGETDKDRKITDLEAKLAESEKKAYSRGHSQRDIANEIKLNALREDVANKEKRIVELKKQLAEKEKEIEELKLKLDIRAISLQNFNIERMQANQDKISFALEQLEKVKETLIQNADDIGEEYKEDYFMISLGNVKNIINNQINELRNNKDGIH